MNLEELSGIDCTLEDCAAFTTDLRPEDLVVFLEKHEGEFIHPHTRDKHPDPAGVIRKLAEHLRWWSGLALRQPALQPEVYDYARAAEHGHDPLSRPGAGNLSYIPETRTFNLHQNTEFPDADPVKVERVGIGLLQFLFHFAPLLKPTYAYIKAVTDPEFEPIPSVDFRETGTVNYLCWANYFGPTLVAKVGERFLLAAPGWQRVKLSCGGILYVVTQSFLDWHFGKHRPYVQYFRNAFPGIDEL